MMLCIFSGIVSKVVPTANTDMQYVYIADSLYLMDSIRFFVSRLSSLFLSSNSNWKQ